MKTATMALSALLLLAPLAATARAGAADDLMAEYKQAGAKDFSAARGKTMWSQPHATPGGPLSCSSCHTADLKRAGAHAITGEAIRPLSPAADPQRLSDRKSVEKWFKRNCKEVLARECTPREKGDFLAYIKSE